mmetsp:Transcript_65269/g.212576  ORF Transcript_65269/g.212576 Transcript_65269/m.212576 type:complete len:270 (+) Transcript_65269:73-882(+)
MRPDGCAGRSCHGRRCIGRGEDLCRRDGRRRPWQRRLLAQLLQPSRCRLCRCQALLRCRSFVGRRCAGRDGGCERPACNARPRTTGREAPRQPRRRPQRLNQRGHLRPLALRHPQAWQRRGNSLPLRGLRDLLQDRRHGVARGAPRREARRLQAHQRWPALLLASVWPRCDSAARLRAQLGVESLGGIEQVGHCRFRAHRHRGDPGDVAARLPPRVPCRAQGRRARDDLHGEEHLCIGFQLLRGPAQLLQHKERQCLQNHRPLRGRDED